MPITDSNRRTFTVERAEQGFRDQAHLDDFYAHFDHVRACGDCGRPGPAVELHDGLQPTVLECPEGQRLYLRSVRHAR